MIRGASCVLLFLATAISAAAEDLGSADLRVEQSELAPARPMNTYLYTTFVRNRGNDTARNVELLILLPLNSRFDKIAHCEASRQSPSSESAGLVRCLLGDLTVGDARKVQFLLRTNVEHPACTAIAVSDTPDPNPMNNIRN